MRRTHASVVFVFLAYALCGAAMADVAVTNWDLQAVNADGSASNPLVGSDTKVIIDGICLNNPEDMLDPALQWQVFVQGVGTDLGGTAAWAGKGFQSSIWSSELARLNASGFRQGDLIRIAGYASDTTGKSNINERHSSAPEMNFTVELLQAGVGLPTPELTTIAEMNDFDSTRLTGGERYQCRRIRLEHVSLLAGSTWGSNVKPIIVDPNDSAETILLRLCNVDFGMQLPATWFNIVGLGDQEATSDLKTNYQVWVTAANGIEVPGDCNLDGRVNVIDLGLLASNYNQTSGQWANADFNGDGVTNVIDLGLLASNYRYGTSGSGEMTPEPTCAILLAMSSVALIRRKNSK
jgi:hypothetical protein